jgi:hypothetical protein
MWVFGTGLFAHVNLNAPHPEEARRAVSKDAQGFCNTKAWSAASFPGVDLHAIVTIE